MKKPFPMLCLLALLATPKSWAWTSPFDSGLRFSLTPLIGFVGNWTGLGIEFGAGYGYAAIGIRHAEGSELCWPCGRESESEKQTSLLVGVRKELPAGVISLRSGFAAIERNIKDAWVSSQQDTEIRRHSGYGVPFQLDLALTGRFIGCGISGTILADSDGGSGGIMLGLPIGFLRR